MIKSTILAKTMETAGVAHVEVAGRALIFVLVHVESTISAIHSHDTIDTLKNVRETLFLTSDSSHCLLDGCSIGVGANSLTSYRDQTIFIPLCGMMYENLQLC